MEQGRQTGLDFLRLELLQDIPFEIARTTEKTLLGPIERQSPRQSKLNQVDGTNQIGDLQQFVMLLSCTLYKSYIESDRIAPVT